MTKQELKSVQHRLYTAGNELCSLSLNLQGTEYYKDFKTMYNAMNRLNQKLIKAINKK